MRAERLGSYSIETTVAGMPYLSRLKSMERNLRLCPPPWWRTVMSPALRRPPVFILARVSGLCGRFVVRSSFTTVEVNRCDGVNDLYVLIAIIVYSLASLLSASRLHPMRDEARDHMFCAYSG